MEKLKVYEENIKELQEHMIHITKMAEIDKNNYTQ